MTAMTTDPSWAGRARWATTLARMQGWVECCLGDDFRIFDRSCGLCVAGGQPVLWWAVARAAAGWPVSAVSQDVCRGGSACAVVGSSQQQAGLSALCRRMGTWVGGPRMTHSNTREPRQQAL